MTTSDWLTILSGTVSIILALVAIAYSYISARDTNDNFQKTKDVLAEIDKKSALIEMTVSQSQKELLQAVLKILNESIPKRVDATQEIGIKVVQAIIANPNDSEKILKAFKSVVSTGPIKTEN